jgi:hypothetical protein
MRHICTKCLASYSATIYPDVENEKSMRHICTKCLASYSALKWGIITFLRDYPADAAILRKLLIEKKPDPAEALPSSSFVGFDGMGEKWQTDLRPLWIVYSGRCNTLIFKGHFRYVVAVFLDSVDEATAKQIIAEDNSRIPCFEGRRVFSTTAYGVTLVWEDIT